MAKLELQIWNTANATFAKNSFELITGAFYKMPAVTRAKNYLNLD